MQLDRFIGRDPTGVARQTLMSLIVWELLAIFNKGSEYGPVEARRCWATEDRDQGLVDSYRWTELGSVALTEAEQFEAEPDPKEEAENGPAGGEPTTEKRYVTDSLPPSAKQLLQASHRHWQIQTLANPLANRKRLHWRLYVTFGKDDSQVRTGVRAKNLRWARRLSVSMLNRDDGADGRTDTKRLRAGLYTEYLGHLLGQR